MAKGGDWQYKLLFISGKDVYSIGSSEVRERMKRLVDMDENILEVQAYRGPLTGVQITKMIFYHLVIVFKTRSYWWSIEKNSEVIAIQRSKNKSDVLDKYKSDKRPTNLFGFGMSQEASTSSISKNIKDLVYWIYSSGQLRAGYNMYDSSCQEFGKDAYHFLTGGSLSM